MSQDNGIEKERKVNIREEKDFLGPNERIDDLQIQGFKIIQNPDKFCFGMDAVLLSDYAGIKKIGRAHV